MRKLYKLVVLYDDNVDDGCEEFTESLEVIEDEETEILDATEYSNKDLREQLFDLQILGDA
tara:strand:+ start:1455 stop:1637 length:183 start_codon:yes stop_codon:yes gene_type:complete